MNESSANKEVSQSIRAIGWVGDDVLGKRAFGFQEVMPSLAIASVYEVGGNHVKAFLDKHFGDGSVSACRLPDAPLEGLDRQERSNSLGRCRVEVMRHTPWIAIIQVRNF